MQDTIITHCMYKVTEIVCDTPVALRYQKDQYLIMLLECNDQHGFLIFPIDKTVWKEEITYIQSNLPYTPKNVSYSHDNTYERLPNIRIDFGQTKSLNKFYYTYHMYGRCVWGTKEEVHKLYIKVGLQL